MKARAKTRYQKLSFLRKLQKDIRAKEAKIQQAEKYIKFLQQHPDHEDADSTGDLTWTIDHEQQPDLDDQKRNWNIICESMKYTEVMNPEELNHYKATFKMKENTGKYTMKVYKGHISVPVYELWNNGEYLNTFPSLVEVQNFINNQFSFQDLLDGKINIEIKEKLASQEEVES